MSAVPTSARVALVTGATNGIGHGIARRLLAAGMTVIVHGPTPELVEGARDRLLLAKLPAERIEFEVADFRDLHAVADLAARIEARHPCLDVLVNNAAVSGSDTRAVTRDGHELVHQVNYLAPYLLTRLLWVPLCMTRQGRVVNVSSSLHRTGNFNWGDMDRAKHYSRTAAYAQSKLQLTMFTRAAAAAGGDQLLAASVHPGVIASGLLPLYARTGAPAAEGAETVSRLCLPETELTDGAYYDGEVQGPFAGLVADERAVARLWKATAKTVGFDRLPTPAAA
ncbi:SDR family NAD(P)-dependent oxidoreductase [Actinospica sp. MGRD01-02]|uniref:SDR family NAD(P)-dependent oxidoreductase n=1 Tax=Actinospica acidithermotolerans TaxID=2828514 RepID=A0A941IK88_9ACTN|nr:SDR family NAD(P)-dependent oxidoreductase [Actinospica acidithermotolerans]MBR7827878.1 SDR family NAD(P)-dependent oxidoreductase [Actinospica acidithermotolerans]